MVTLWLFNIAIKNGPFIDGLPTKNGGFSMAQTGALPPVSPSSGPRVIGSAEDYRHTDFVELTAPILTMAALPMIFNDCSLADGVTGHGNISQLET
jgi:hypothetical protein